MASWWLALVILVASISKPVFSDPQINPLKKDCSQYNVTDDPPEFFRKLNASFADLRNQLSGSGNKRFATTQQPVYAIVQCRKYLSTADCAACYDAAVSVIRSCSAANGARVIFDGCFLRYESNYFYDQSVTLPTISAAICSNPIHDLLQYAYNIPAQRLVDDLHVATPKINGFFAAAQDQMSGSDVPSVNGVAQCIETISKSGCQECLTIAYWNIQDCAAKYADGRAIEAACFLRYSYASFFEDYQTTNLAPYLNRVVLSKKVGIITGGILGGLLLLSAVIFLCKRLSVMPYAEERVVFIACGIARGLSLLWLAIISLCNQLSAKVHSAERGDTLGETDSEAPGTHRYKNLKAATEQFCFSVGKILRAATSRGPTTYRYKDLKAATKNFSKTNELGRGACGVVYKAELRNGSVVAVKKIPINSDRAKADIDTEVKLISDAHHPNLVRLLGYCTNGAEVLLVYEYMENGSLDKYLYGEKRGRLNWKQRFDIIYRVAKGLAHLHEIGCIVHRDIKPSNILLDDKFQPKIADFGMARLYPKDLSHLTTKNFAGTLGYSAPEYVNYGHLSEKADVYSFGIMVLEIVSGRKSTDIQIEPVTKFLLDDAWKLYKNDRHLELVDETLDPNGYTPEDMKRIIEIGLICTQSPPTKRPSMEKVVFILLCDRSIEQRPTHMPAFLDYETRIVEAASISNATASASELMGR